MRRQRINESNHQKDVLEVIHFDASCVEIIK